MILKILLIAAVIAAVYFMFFKTKPTVQKSAKKEPKRKPTAADVNDMTECATCGVYVEVKEAILSNGKYYCSRECLKKAN